MSSKVGGVCVAGWELLDRTVSFVPCPHEVVGWAPPQLPEFSHQAS